MDKNMLKWNARVVRMEDNRWPNDLVTKTKKAKGTTRRRKRKWKGLCGVEQFNMRRRN
jgi:hypothetical protein